MSEASEKVLKVRSIYDAQSTENPSGKDEKDSTLAYGENVLISCFEAHKLNKLVLDRVRPAAYSLSKHEPKSFETECLAASLNFFKIIEKRKKLLKARTQTPRIPLAKQLTYQEAYHHKSFLHEKELEDDDEKRIQQVPKIYDGFSVLEDQDLSTKISGVLDSWRNCLEKEDVVRGSIAFLTLRTMIICGEYLHLHKLKNVELKLWYLAYYLARALNQLKTLIYITSRCLKLKYINHSWIESSDDYIKNNEELQDTEVVAIFWLELASFYFDCGKNQEAKLLLQRVKKLRCYDYPKQTNDPMVYGYAADVEFRNYFVDDKSNQEGYVELIVKIHYTLRDFHDSIDDTRKYDEVEYKLLGYSKMFDMLCNVIMPSVSLHNYFEIYSHINDWFHFAQQRGWTLRIADCLKYMCYIDLLLHRATEEKVDELEKMLCLSQFKEWPLVEGKRKKKYVYNGPTHYEKKPELKKKLFRIPDCLSPSTPQYECFSCTNLDYLYTLFACAYIRAQLYCFVDYEIESEQYFCGAAKMQQIMDERDSVECRSHGEYKWKRDRNYTADLLMFIVDFGLSIQKFTPEHDGVALRLFEKAIAVAVDNDLTMHPASVFATEMMFEHHVYSLDQDKLLSAIYVPPTKKSNSGEKNAEEEEKGSVTRSKSAKLALEQKAQQSAKLVLEQKTQKSAKLVLEQKTQQRAKLGLEQNSQQGMMTRSKTAKLLEAQASSLKK